MQLVETSPWLHLEPDLLEALTADQAVMRLRRKQPVFHQKDMPTAVYIVKSGRICITTYSQTGMEQQLYIAEQGSLFGEHSCLLGAPHMTSSVSIVESELYAIPTQVFLTRIQENTSLNKVVMQIMCRKNSILIGRLLSQSSSDSLQRIAQFLVNMATEYGLPTEGGLEISIRFSHQDVANLLHTSRVTVTKAFQHLARLNIISRQKNRIVVSDLARLQQIASDGLTSAGTNRGQLDRCECRRYL